MPQKPGIFTRFKDEILELLAKGTGYTEIAEIIHEKHGIKTTKQNLQKSHQQYLKNESIKARKSASKSRRGKDRENSRSGGSKQETQAAQKKSDILHDPNAARRDKAALFLEFKALLERELATGRFSRRETKHVKGFGQLLFHLHAQTCVDVFQACHGRDFLTYQNAVSEAMDTISNEQLYKSDKAFDPTPEEQVYCFCGFMTDDGEETTLADRIPNFIDELRAAQKEAELERERLGEDGFITF